MHFEFLRFDLFSDAHYLLRGSIYSLGWRLVPLTVTAGVAAHGAWRGRVWRATLLPLSVGLFTQEGLYWVVKALEETDNLKQFVFQLHGVNQATHVAPVAGLLGLLLLPACRGAGRSRLNVGIAVVGMVWPLLSLIPRAVLGEPSGLAPWVSLVMGFAALTLLWRPNPSPNPLSALAAYASLATVVAAAAVPEVSFVHSGIAAHAPTPEQRCAEMWNHVVQMSVCSTLAIGSALLALVPLWMEARRTGQRRLAVGISLALLVGALAMSPSDVLGAVFLPASDLCPP